MTEVGKVIMSYSQKTGFYGAFGRSAASWILDDQNRAGLVAFLSVGLITLAL